MTELLFDSMKLGKPEIDVQGLHAKIGELVLANDFLQSEVFKTGKPSARK